MDLLQVRKYAETCYNNANSKYDGQSYMVHVDMVRNVILLHKQIFISTDDYENTIAAADCHDLIEDAKQTFNDIASNSNTEVANIVLAVSDTPAENRLMRHLLTMPRTVKDHRALILKLADILANATYSFEHGSSMYNKYKSEYVYRRAIFKKALLWYPDKLNQSEVNKLWDELDNIFQIKKGNVENL